MSYVDPMYPILSYVDAVTTIPIKCDRLQHNSTTTNTPHHHHHTSLITASNKPRGVIRGFFTSWILGIPNKVHIQSPLL